jgi:hypothetical protein
VVQFVDAFVDLTLQHVASTNEGVVNSYVIRLDRTILLPRGHAAFTYDASLG